MNDILTRAFGPPPDDPHFRPFDESKIIPVHDCVWLEQRAWGCVWVGCRVCHSSAPEIVTRGDCDV